MFKLVEERLTWQPVIFHGWTDDGKRIDNQIEVQFALLSTDANLKLMQEAGELTVAEAADDEAEQRSLSQVMAAFGVKIVRDWRLVAEANGDPVKFSEEGLARLFNLAPGSFEATLRAYRDACAGGKDAREKN